MVVVSEETGAISLSYEGKLVRGLKAEFLVVTVETPEAQTAERQAAIAKALELAEDLGATVITLTGRDIALGSPPHSVIGIGVGGNIVAWILYGVAFQLLVRGVQVLDALQPRGGPVRQLGRIRVPGPDEVPADVGPAKQVDQAVCLLPGGGVHGVEVAGDDQLPRPAAWPGHGELPGLLVDPGVASQHRPGAGGIHHEAGGVRGRGTPTATTAPGHLPRAG